MFLVLRGARESGCATFDPEQKKWVKAEELTGLSVVCPQAIRRDQSKAIFVYYSILGDI